MHKITALHRLAALVRTALISQPFLLAFAFSWTKLPLDKFMNLWSKKLLKEKVLFRHMFIDL